MPTVRSLGDRRSPKPLHACTPLEVRQIKLAVAGCFSAFFRQSTLASFMSIASTRRSDPHIRR